MRRDIGPVEDFPEGEATPVEVEGRLLAVFNVSGDVYALQDNCPHKNLPLSVLGDPTVRGDGGGSDDIPTLGRIEHADRTIDCPWHNLEWDLETGESPVLNTHVPTYDVAVVDGRVVVDL